jgi:serine/threonine-protein phosphatase 5
LDPALIEVDGSYQGPRIGDDGVVTIEFVRAMVEHFKSQKMIHRK